MTSPSDAALRKIDRLVAEKVMGITVHPRRRDEPLKDYIAPYSTSISDAWLVVKRMRELGWYLKLIHFSGDEYWSAEFDRITAIGDAHEETAPLAICLAALKALSVEVTDAE